MYSRCVVCACLFAAAACLSVAFLATFGSADFALGDSIIQTTLLPVSGDPGLLEDPHPNGYSIQDIINAGGIQIGDKLFDAFSVTSLGSGGALAPDAADIRITPIEVLQPPAPFGGDFGMIFNAAWVAMDGQSVNSTIQFAPRSLTRVTTSRTTTCG